MIQIAAPKLFDFEKTTKMLQRGIIDPINVIEKNMWTRCFHHENKIILIKTEKNKKIFTNVLQGEITDKKLKALLIESLGLTDPILNNKVNNIPFVEKIESVMGLSVPGYPNLFEAIVQIIMGQQISVVVANNMRARFTRALGGEIQYQDKIYHYFPLPETVMKQPVEKLQALGLSHTKSKSILEVARAFCESESILSINPNSSPDFIRKTLVQLYGVGDWTVDWLLLRGFRQFDIIPATDLAVRKAISWWLNKKQLIESSAVKKLEKKLFPFGGVIVYRVLCAYSHAMLRSSGD